MRGVHSLVYCVYLTHSFTAEIAGRAVICWLDSPYALLPGMDLAFKIWRDVLDLRVWLHAKSLNMAKLCMNLTKSRHISHF